MELKQMHEPKSHNHRFGDRMRSPGSRAVFALTLAILLLGSGCVSTTVSLDAPPPVTQARAKRDLGIDYLSTGRTAMAIRELRASIALDDSDPQTSLWLGEAYRRKGEAVQAEENFANAARLAKRSKDQQTEQDARLNLSALLSQMGRHEEAIEQCEVLVEDPTFSAPWQPLTNCGWARMQLGRLDEARADFVEALDYFPRFGPALLNLGILEAKEGHQLEAIQRFEKALAGNLGRGASAEAHYRLGEIFVALGDRQRAVSHFDAAAESAPNRDWGSQSQVYLDLLR